jgi:hypothetical protein
MRPSFFWFRSPLRVRPSIKCAIGMALWTRSSRQEDDFFGADGDDDYMAHDGEARRCDDTLVGHSSNGLALHEAAAVEERYRVLGYHETYESSREATLQDGFIHGYTDTFPIALNIGRLLGQAAIAQKLTELTVSERNQEAIDDAASNDETEARPLYLAAASRIRSGLLAITSNEESSTSNSTETAHTVPQGFDKVRLQRIRDLESEVALMLRSDSGF